MREFFEVISEHPFVSVALGVFILAITDVITTNLKHK